MSELKAGILFLVVLAAAQAQVGYPGGGYPGGGYPGGGYPGGGYPGQYPYPGGGRGPTVPGIPIPRKGSKQPSTKDDAQPLPNFRGKLKQMDGKTITLELGDNRLLEFKRTDKTKFYKGGDELKSPDFKPGDQISVEGPEDPHGYMVAVNVYWEKSASAGAKTGDEKDGVVDTWKDSPGPSGPTAAEHATEMTAPPAKPSPDDPGPPKLQRGKPADSARERAPAPPPEAPVAANLPHSGPEGTPAAPPPSEVAAPRQPSIARGEEDAGPSSLRSDDPLIRKAANAALDFTETLPSYVCQEMMARFQSDSHPASFQPIDVVRTEVVYENGKEDYRNITINGKAVKKSMEETGGAWSTGEFGTLLVDLFSPATAAEFHFRRDSRAGPVLAKMYDFDVARESSHWAIHAGSQMYQPSYSGVVWIDPKTARVLRIEMQAKGMPGEFPLDHVESATDYEYIRLGDTQQYLLPVHAETLSCQRSSNLCAKNIIDFRNYHKYAGESNIKFGEPVSKDKP